MTSWIRVVSTDAGLVFGGALFGALGAIEKRN